MEPKHILVIRLSAMGDVAMTIPVLKTLTKQHSNLKITVVSKAFLQPLFEDIDNLNFYAADVNGKHKGIKGIYKLYQELTLFKIDAVADLHNVLRSKILRSFFKLNGTPIACINKGRTEKKALTALKNKLFKPLKTTHQRYADVFEPLGFTLNLSKPAFKDKQPLLEELKPIFNYQEHDKMIGIAPFSAHQGKNYPLELMEKVIEELSKHAKILLFGGGQKEISVLTELTKKYNNTYCVAGKTKLKAELNLISNLNAMISMDSGNGHFSAMYGVPTITIWGATHPFAGFAPFNQTENCICADRNQYPLLPTSVYGNKIIPGYEKVMETITPNTIINKVLSTIK
ncbi:glycosyltransferase family 9 protein [Wenyingzhuangia sp. 2_MG-2023]|uniref:glycosyltransferase family 9 protein n=1 Tax=Wenyingzhuangia sp. 2_MG-2023 TaxID=3062639 RepID=UPI0026E13206|nr:glycosyltransferase family 9 protein [Wenyingzhuangia sp. 2_MG-2023]MDO6737727.1 glycosyltransferase family 9 protein [Wenyingzhuangia sp. 2_MG-2023]